MKKFTGNFLLDEHSLGGVLRKIGLSMVAILMAVVAFAQEPQDTYHVWAETADDYCFQRVNEYEVDILMRDFVKIDTFELILNYDEDVFSYGGYVASSVHPVLLGGSGISIAKTDDGELTFQWGCEDPATEGTISPDNDTTVVFTLKFVVDGVPYSYGPVAPVPFQSDLEWDADAYGVWDNVGQVTDILTNFSSDGSLTVTQMWDDITLVADSAFCFDGEGTVTVTVPDEEDMTYSFNGTTFTTNPTTDVLNIPDEGKVVNAWVELDGCVSYKKSITVFSPDSLYFTAVDTVYVQCDGEDGDIEIVAHGGTPAYTYFVVPEDEFGAAAGTTLTAANWVSELDDYITNNAVTQAEPGIYWVTGNDAVNCNKNNIIAGWNDDGATTWTWVEVLDTVDPLSVVVTIDSVQCYEGEDGMYTLDIAGGTPFDNDVTEEYGYKVWRNGSYLGVIPADSTLSQDDLMAGDIEFYIEDANGCSMETTIEIWQPDPITFMVEFEDASCYDPEVDGSGDVGKIWIDTLSIKGGSGYDAAEDTTDLTGYWWVYSTSPNFEAVSTDTVADVFTSVDTVAAGVYYVRVFDAEDCFDDFVNPTGDNAVKVLTTQFDLVYDSITCYDGYTDVTIDIETGTGNHTFLYGMWPNSSSTDTTGLAWQASNTFLDIYAGTHTFFVYDVTIECLLSYTEEVTEPSRLNAFVWNNLTLPPSCPENTDGNLVIGAVGGTPFVNNGISQYEYKLDDNAWVLPSAYGTFAVDTAPHKIFIRDAHGCVDSVMFDWDDDINYIQFEDTIWNQCPMELVNIFNKYPWNDYGVDTIGEDYDGIDWGFLEDFEWYGNGMEEFDGTTYSSYWFWTSAEGWFEVVGQGVQQQRNPEWYIVDFEPASEQEIVDNSMGSREDGAVDYTDSWAAGDYWVVAMDEWGCFSNIEKIVIMDPASLEVTITTEPAGCDGSTDGKIIMEALNGRFDIPNTPGFVRYEFVLTQQPQIFGHDNWVEQVTWRPFTDGSFTNDSLGVINVQASDNKPYYVAVRDWCATEKPALIWFSEPITITGASAIEIAGDIEDYITDVTCIVDGKDAEYDGSVMGLLEATSGGFGGYTYTLESTWTVDKMEDPIDLVNETGDFDSLPGGDYILTIVDDSLGCEAVYTFSIAQPEPLRFDYVLVNPSCFDAHDGILRYMISGGTAPYWEVTNNTGAWQDAEDITASQWVETASEGWWAYDVVSGYDSTWVFDRRVRQNEKQIYIKDANGCIWEVANVSVKAPAKLEITEVISNPVSCNDQDELNEGDLADGSIVFIPKGGWNQKDTVVSDMVYDSDSLFMYTATLWKKNTTGTYIKQVDTMFNVLDTIMFEDLAIGDYKITLYEYSDSLAAWGWEYPVGTYTNYWNSAMTDEWSMFAPFQNPLVEENDFSDKLCVASYEVSVEEPDPITYDTIYFNAVQCYNTETGTIKIENIQGGIPGLSTWSGGYWVGLEGPADFHPTLQTGYDTLTATVIEYTNVAETDSIIWFATGAGVNEFTFDHLNWGHYTVHIKDSMECWIYKESGEIGNPDTLEIEIVELVENALCNGDNTGVIQIDATGGVEPYMYAVDPTLMPNPEDARFPNSTDLGYYLDSVLVWQESDTFNVTAGTWVGYVKDANGCVVGFATRPNGADIWQHRVDVIEPDAVEIDGIGQDSVLCYDGTDGAITIDTVFGGKGGAWAFRVVGTDYMGNVVDTMYDDVDDADIVLGGLPASTDKDPQTDTLTAEDYYMIYAYDNADCVSAGDSMYVLQPEEFVIQVKSKQDALICYSDQAGLYEIDVLSGGVPFGMDANDEPIYEFKLEAYTPEGVLIDSLSDDTYAKVKTFNGYAGLDYTVWARDANGCETSVDTFIAQPMPVDFMVEDLTCYGDTLAAAKVTITSGNEGRSYQVWYKEILNENVADVWTKYNGWFEGSIVIDTTFIFDNENLQDRHYAVMVVDTMGCMSGVDTLTFDKVQNELTMETTVTATEACPVQVDLEVNGGTGPYTILIDGEAVVGFTHMLTTGAHEIKALDAHYCEVIDSVEVMGLVRDTLVETYFGEEVMFSDVTAGVVDTMLVEGVYTFPYDNEEGCTTVLTVTVEGVPYMLSIMEVQSEADSSEYVGSIVEVDGTVTEVVAGAGFYMQDANAAWGGIYVSTTETTGLQIGNGVVVTGTVDEIAGVTTIVSTEVELVTPVLTVTPVVVTAGEVADEMYESVLVIVEGGRAMSKDTVTNEWVVLTDAEATVNDLFYDAEVVVDHYYDVTGIVNGMDDAYTIEPRDEDDVVDLTATPNNDITSSIEFKVYPNPFNDRIIIDNNDKLTRIVVSNIAGQRVIDIEYPSHEIRTANLVSGVYVISMFTEDGIAKTERIVKR